ncbi:MAG: glycosyltransferase family 9 protein, partial [Phycisphaerae bacterium]
RPKSTPDATRTVLIHPGSGGVSKCWSVAGFVAVASELARRGVAVRFAIGPAERERWSGETVARFADVAAVETLESIDDFARSVACADAYLGNDSGPTHLAEWLGKPTLALFGPTDVRIWRPLGDRATWLQGDPAVDAATWGIQPARIAALFGDVVA